MKVIDYDPASKIPNFTERTFNNSIVIAIWESTHSLFVSYVIKIDKMFKFRGSSKIKEIRREFDHYYGAVITWSDSINNGVTLLHLLERDWKGRTYPQWLNVKYYILENLSDLTNIVDMYNIDGQLHTELLYIALKKFRGD